MYKKGRGDRTAVSIDQKQNRATGGGELMLEVSTCSRLA